MPSVEAVSICELVARATSFYQAALDYRRSHPDTELIDELVAESYGLLVVAHAEYVTAGRAL